AHRRAPNPSGHTAAELTPPKPPRLTVVPPTRLAGGAERSTASAVPLSRPARARHAREYDTIRLPSRSKWANEPLLDHHERSHRHARVERLHVRDRHADAAVGRGRAERPDRVRAVD